MSGRHPAAWVSWAALRDHGQAWSLAAPWVLAQHVMRGGGTPLLVAEPTWRPPSDSSPSTFRRLLSPPSAFLRQAHDRELADTPMLAWQPDEGVLAVLARGASDSGRALCVVQGPCNVQVRAWAAEVGAIDLAKGEHPRVSAALQELREPPRRAEKSRQILLGLHRDGLLNPEQVLPRLHADLPPVEVRFLEIMMRDFPYTEEFDQGGE